MNLDPKIFKAYDIRGIYPDQMDEEAVAKIGQAAVQILKAKRIVIGHDMRTSADNLYASLKNGLLEMGIEIIDIGLCSTSMTYFADTYFKTDASLMLTASHDPANYNGFKICGPGAQYITTFAKTTDIYDLIINEQIKTSSTKGTIKEENILDAYVDAVSQGISIKKGKIKKIVIDAGNGMAGVVMPKLLERLGVDYKPLYFELDGRFPNHKADPLTLDTLKDLQKTVVEEGADLGVAFDGDGDRIGFVDEKGEIITGDMLTILIAKEKLKDNPNLKIIYDIRCSKALKEQIEASGGQAIVYKVGHGLIKPEMRRQNADFAGELSAHFYFKELDYTDNGDRALAFILQLISEDDKKISERINSFKKYFDTGEINFTVADPKEKIKEIDAGFKEGKRSYLDGVTIEFDNWWFNLRPSNTEPLLRLNLEANTPELMEEKKNLLFKLIGTHPVTD